MHIAILGSGPLGLAVEAAASRRNHAVLILGHPSVGGHLPGLLRGVDIVVDASVPDAVVRNLGIAVKAGCRGVVITTAGWDYERSAAVAILRRGRTAAVTAGDSHVVLQRQDYAAMSGWLGRDSAAGTHAIEVRSDRAQSSGEPSPSADWFIEQPITPPRRVEHGTFGSGAPHQHRPRPAAGLIEGDISARAFAILLAAHWLALKPRAARLHSLNSVIEELSAPRVWR